MSDAIDLDELRSLRTPLIVYVGPELSRAAGLPSRRELARRLVDALPEETTDQRRLELAGLAEAPDLADAFTELERDLTAARFGREVERALRDDGLEPPSLARALAGLGRRVQGIITPNLDRLLEHAFASRWGTCVRPSMELLQRDAWLLKLNGTLPERASWVFTREQHARARRRDPAYAQVLRAFYVNKPMLFVGTPVDDTIFDELLALACDLNTLPKHWALIPRSELGPAARAKLDDAGISTIRHDTEHEMLEQLVSIVAEPVAISRSTTQAQDKPSHSVASGPMRILFVSANPLDMDSVAVDREQRVVREAIARARRRQSIQLEVRVAACFADLSRALLESPFDLVHVAGHGQPIGSVLDEGDAVPVPPAELAALFDEYAAPRGRLRCVLLNACWSADASEPIAKVPTVVAMRGPIDDRAALAFTEGFYDAIGAGHDFAAAHREGQRRARSSVPGGPFDSQLVQRG